MDVCDEEEERYVLRLKTVQCAAVRNLFETLKDMLQDCNLVFSPHGVSCLQMDNNKSVMVSLNLSADKFEQYFCVGKIHAGINVGNMFRLIKSIGQSDTLEWKIPRVDQTVMQMTIQNFDKRMSSSYEINLLDIEDLQWRVPPIDNFHSIVTMQSLDFQRICRDLAGLSENIRIQCSNRKLVMSAAGDFAKQTVVLEEIDLGLHFSCCDESVPFEGKYSLKYLNLFSKANVLCSTVDVYMKCASPIILTYTVASLGKLTFCLSEKQEI